MSNGVNFNRQDRIIRVSADFLSNPGDNMRANRDRLLEVMARGEVDLIQVESDIPQDMLKYAKVGQTSCVVAVIGVIDAQVVQNIKRIKEAQTAYSKTISGYLSDTVNRTICNAKIVEGVPFDEALNLDSSGRFSINNGLSSRFFTSDSGIMTILPPKSSQVFETCDVPTFVAFSPYYHLEQLYGVPHDLGIVRDMSETALEASHGYGSVHNISRFERVVHWDGVEDEGYGLRDVISTIDAMPDPLDLHMRQKGILRQDDTAQVTEDARGKNFAAREIP